MENKEFTKLKSALKKELRKDIKNEKKKGIQRIAKDVADFEFRNKRIVSSPNVRLKLSNFDVEKTEPRSNFFKETWEEEKRRLFFE